MEVVWRNVVGYEGKYMVSNQNGFYNIALKKECKGTMAHGYREVSMGKRNHKLYHIIVAKAFPEICGEWFSGCEVHHKNFNKLDNRPENLIVLSKTDHSKIHYEFLPDSYKKPSKKRNSSISKALRGRRAVEKHIPVIQLSLNGEKIREWECISDVAKIGYSPGNICMCCKGQLKTAYGFLWQYAVSN